jgi:probable rRNA maturation factor
MTASPKAPGVTLIVEDEKWRAVRGLQARLKQAAALALSGARRRGALTILLGDDGRLKSLNREFRGLGKPTNVLSFPSQESGYLGDIAIAYGVASREAKAAGRTLIDHATHLAVHGVLHLVGYDHERPRDAKIMEPLEVRILARLRIADPYRTDAP